MTAPIRKAVIGERNIFLSFFILLKRKMMKSESVKKKVWFKAPVPTGVKPLASMGSSSVKSVFEREKSSMATAAKNTHPAINSATRASERNPSITTKTDKAIRGRAKPGQLVLRVRVAENTF